MSKKKNVSIFEAKTHFEFCAAVGRVVTAPEMAPTILKKIEERLTQLDHDRDDLHALRDIVLRCRARQS